MRVESGIAIATQRRGAGRGAGRPLRFLACVLTVLALLAAHVAASGGAPALADEPRGIDLPFTSRDDEQDAGDGADDGSSFALTVYVCIPGGDTDLRDRLLVETSTDPDDFFADGIDLDELRDVCAEPAESLTYTLTDLETDKTDARELGGQGEPATTWDTLSSAGGRYTLGVDAPGNYADPIVICTVASDPPGTLTQYYATDGTIQFYSEAGRSHTCEWFNVDLGDEPPANAGAASPVASAAGSATVAIRAHTCIPGDDADLLARITYQIEHVTAVDPVRGISLAELLDACDAPGESIAFTVTNTQDSSEGETQTLDGDGTSEYATWDMEAYMIHSVDAGEPEGYGAPIVFCSLDDTGEPTPAPMADGVLYAAMGPGTTYTCDWFHVDPGDPDA